MAADNERFLSRWSRRKHEQEREDQVRKEEEARAPVAEDAAPPLPPLEGLTPASDFTPFMQPKVQDSLRRLALKKLFSDPHFNLPDLMEPYSGDWTVAEPISEELLARLEHTRTMFRKVEDKLEPEGAQLRESQVEEQGSPPAVAAQTAEQEPKQVEDEPRRQDT